MKYRGGGINVGQSFEIIEFSLLTDPDSTSTAFHGKPLESARQAGWPHTKVDPWLEKFSPFKG